MGAYLSRLKNVNVCIMSDSKSINPEFDMVQEVSDSLNKIYKVDSLVIEDINTMYFVAEFQNIRNKLFKIKCDLNPDTVFCTSLNSIHPDHRIIAEACESIFIQSSIFSFEPYRSAQKFKPTKLIGISQKELDTKIKALSCYKSQKEKPTMHMKVITASATYYGSFIDHEYAEPFEIIREVNRLK